MEKKITIITPMYGAVCSGLYAKSLAESFVGLKDLGYDVKYLTLFNESLITRARNMLTEAFLRSDSDYLLFIDADQSFDYKDIHKMIEEDKDILGAVVPMKQINWTAVRTAIKLDLNPLEYTAMHNFNTIDDKPITDASKPFEVKYMGTGMMLIKREVLESLKSFVPTYKHNSGTLNGVNTGDLVHEFFATSIDSENNLLSEDFHFCDIAKNQGYKIFAVGYPKITHAGTYFFR